MAYPGLIYHRTKDRGDSVHRMTVTLSADAFTANMLPNLKKKEKKVSYEYGGRRKENKTFQADAFCPVMVLTLLPSH